MTPVTLTDRFVLAGDRARVRRLLDDVAAVIACIPGASIRADNGDGTYAAEIGVQYGETGVRLGGAVAITWPAPDEALVKASGRDAVGTVKAEGEIRLRLAAEDGGSTPVDLDARFDFSGVLAPLARSATKIVGPQLMKSFARCLAARVTASPG